MAVLRPLRGGGCCVEFCVQCAGRGGAAAGRLDVESVDVLFRAPGGARVCSRWAAAAAEVVFEHCASLEPFTVRGGRRLAPGWWWSATTGRLVPYGSAAMRLHVMLLNRDSRVSGLAARPLELRWPEQGRVRAHAPELMFRLGDGQGVLADCTTRAKLSQRQRSLAAVVGELCAAVGWRYWVLGPVASVYRRNVTWLAGYRHLRYRGGLVSLDARLEGAAARPVIMPETVVVDQGSVFVSASFVAACESLGVSVQPAPPANGPGR